MTALAPAAQPSAFGIFRNRSFVLLWIAQLVSVSGSALTSLAAALLVFKLTGSALSVGLVLIVTSLPSMVVGLFAGVFVDRYDRKRIMISADLLRAALIVAIPFVVQFGIVWLYVLLLLAGAIGQFFEPAQQSVLPEVASDDELAAANAIMTIADTGSWAVGFAAAGLLASAFSIDWAFYIDAATFLVSAACISGVRIAAQQPEDDTTVATVLRDLRQGMRFIAATPIIRSLFIVMLIVWVGFGLNNALLLPFSLRALHATEFEYGLLEGICSIGLVVGSLLMSRVADRLHESQWIAVGLLVMATVQIVLALLTSLPFAFMAMMISGFANAFTLIARRVLLQRNTPNELRGRMFSAFLSAGNLALALGMAAAGLADLINVRVLFLLAAVPLLLAGLLVLLLPGLRQSLAEWRQATRMLRGMAGAPGLGRGQAATLGDFDRLANRLPVLFHLSPAEQRALLSQARVYDVPAGAAIMREGEAGNTVYFIIEGRAVAGKTIHDTQRALGVLHAGDIFGEIGALMGTPRTATVLAQEPTSVMQVPAAVLRQLMGNAALNSVLLERMLARMERMRALSEAPTDMGAQPMRRGPEMPSQIMAAHGQGRSAAEATKALLGGAGEHATVIIPGQF